MPKNLEVFPIRTAGLVVFVLAFLSCRGDGKGSGAVTGPPARVPTSIQVSSDSVFFDALDLAPAATTVRSSGFATGS